MAQLMCIAEGILVYFGIFSVEMNQKPEMLTRANEGSPVIMIFLA
jgi:hypothetical protein